MKIIVNGKAVTLEKEITVIELLKEQNVEMPEYVTVQVNDELLGKEDHETFALKEGDVVEFLYFMGGGTL